MSAPIVPIITSILDTDAYKLHMQQAVYRQQLIVPATFDFINRNKHDHFGMYADEIRAQIQALANVSLTEEEYEYLQKLPHFKSDYIEYLKTYRFNISQVEVTTVAVPPDEVLPSPFNETDEDLVVRVSGPWHETILFEVPLLAIISEVVQRHRYPDVGVQDALKTLDHKLEKFAKSYNGEDLSHFHVCDFGSRRRFSKEVHNEILKVLSTDPRFSPYLCGTSNYDIARRLQLSALGTQAHEWFQAFQRLAPSLRDSQITALEMWLKEYPVHLGIALTDCITMDAFLCDFDERFAKAFTGLRHDSGDPVTWGKKAIAHYHALGIDPQSKTLIFSDGLNLDSAVHLYQVFHNEISVMFGIGTQLTCSIKGVQPLNIVLKMKTCLDCPVAKISDAPSKTCCGESEYIEELKRTFLI